MGEVMEMHWRLEPATEQMRALVDAVGFVCIICKEMLWMPVSCGKCGVFYCESCYQQWRATTGAKYQCAKCRDVALPVSVVNNQMLKTTIMNNLQIKCPGYVDAGCTWTGNYLDGKDHVDNKCGKATTKCHHCKDEMCRSSLATHLCPQRPVVCDGCKKGPYSPTDLSKHQITDCPARIVMCDAVDCKWNGPLSQFTNHEATCQELRIACPIPNCKTVLKRKNMPEHHTTNALQHVDLLQAEITTLKQRIPTTTTSSNQNQKKRKRHNSPPPTNTTTNTTINRDIISIDDLDQLDNLINSAPMTTNATTTTATTAATRMVEQKDDKNGSRWLNCTTTPACPFSGKYDRLNPFGKRCFNCNRDRSNNKVPCDLGLSPQCWHRVYPSQEFGNTCKPCREL